jgi:hypothetical protein
LGFQSTSLCVHGDTVLKIEYVTSATVSGPTLPVPLIIFFCGFFIFEQADRALATTSVASSSWSQEDIRKYVDILEMDECPEQVKVLWLKTLCEKETQDSLRQLLSHALDVDQPDLISFRQLLHSSPHTRMGGFPPSIFLDNILNSDAAGEEGNK